MEKRDTVGKLSSELLQRDVYGDVTAGEQMQEQLQKFPDGLIECIDRGKSKYPGDFYIDVLFKREQILVNTLTNYFIDRWTCPTPRYDQAVFKYNKKDDRIEFLWSIPNPAAIKNLLAHKDDIDPSFFPLLTFVLQFLDGTLDRKCRELNGEGVIIS